MMMYEGNAHGQELNDENKTGHYIMYAFGFFNVSSTSTS